MRALRAHDLDGPHRHCGSTRSPIPPRPDEDAVRIDVHAAGIGFVDTLVTRGQYQVRQEPPFTPGMEVAGVVASAPPGSGLSVGQRVYASRARRRLRRNGLGAAASGRSTARFVECRAGRCAGGQRPHRVRRPGSPGRNSARRVGAGARCGRRSRLGGGAHRRGARRPGHRGGQHAAASGGGDRGRGAPGVRAGRHGWTRCGRTAARTSSSTRSAEMCSTRRCGRWPRRAGCSPSATSPAASRRPRRTGCCCATAMSEESTGAA